MNMLEILQKPLITEKTYKLMEQNKYVFVVSPRASKADIKSAFESVFAVKVQDINLIKMKPKKKRKGRYLGKKPGVRKAIITLKPDQKLNLFEDDSGNIDTDKSKLSIFERFRKNFLKTDKHKSSIKKQSLIVDKKVKDVIKAKENEN